MANTINVSIMLTAEQAAALKRFAEKITYERAESVLYAHVSVDVRASQVTDIISAFAVLEERLRELKVSDWPWIETGQP